MSIIIPSKHDSKETSMDYSTKNVSEEFLQDTDKITNITLASNCDNSIGDAEQIKLPDEVLEVANVSPEKTSFENEESPIDSTYLKTYTVKEAHETSPFRQAVRGFVLNKLSKKVGSSHILSGLTEKLVKKLEEGKETVQNTETEKQHIPQIKEMNIELTQDSQPCELKSVVANDLSEQSHVEEAIECFEEIKTPLSDSVTSRKLTINSKTVSKSLPSSPAHHFGRRASVGNASDNEEKNNFAEQTNAIHSSISSYENLSIKNSAISGNDTHGNEMELDNGNKDISDLESSIQYKNHSNGTSNEYPLNAYVGKENDESKIPPTLNKDPYMFFTIKNILLALPLSHLILLAALIIHNSNLFSSYYIDYIFDSFVIAYICYSLIYIWIQTPVQIIATYPAYYDTHLEVASLQVDQVSKYVKGSAKVLKGTYDPEEKHHDTELVNICIESHCLKIYPTNLSEEEEESCLPYETYDLCGGSISIVPKGLTKKRTFHKKYPICITLPLASKALTETDTFEDLDKEEKMDYVSLIPYSDGLLEMTKHRALYLFALTDREKESWFWALTKSIQNCATNSTMKNVPLAVCSPKFDLSSMSYASLMESNVEETLSITEDNFGKTTEIRLTHSKVLPTLTFERYMKVLFENYNKTLNLQNIKSELLPDSSSKDIFKSSCSVEWLNIALGRLFYDFLSQKQWADYVISQIQTKLDKIEMPNFVESIKVTDVYMGTKIPQFHSVSDPTSDNSGVWFDFNFIYNGSFQMTLKTKMKIPRGKTLHQVEVPESADNKQNAEGSDASDDDGSRTQSPTHQNKIINKIEKWISYKHFQAVAQSKFVKKYVGDISNMPLTLTVEVNKLQGVLTVNIPPVPSDRIWYGFRNDPILSLTASPKVGTREINLSAVVQMIERKLIHAFKKALVMPNMDDVVIPIMFSPVYDQ